MSKTDKTAPFWVKQMRGDLNTEEVHDHTEGPCDLPARDIAEQYWYPHKTRCYRTFSYDGTHVCCCAWCHGDTTWDIPPGRRQRIEGKKAVRRWADEY